MMKLNNYQKRRLWSMLCQATQGKYGVLYDEDHEYDDDMEKYIESLEAILNSTYKGEWAEESK